MRQIASPGTGRASGAAVQLVEPVAAGDAAEHRVARVQFLSRM